MDYEKKMTREEAIEKVRKMSLPKETVEILEALAPELRESEDERIRKALIEVFKEKLERGFEWVEYGIPNRSVLSWLEKQKERGPLTKEEEYNLHRIIEFLEDEACPSEWISLLYDIYCHPYQKQKEQKHPNGCFTCDEYKKGYEEGRRNGFTAGYNKAMKEVEQKEQNGEDEECTDFTIYHPLKNGKGEYECIPYSFYGSLTSFSEDKDLIDFLRTCFYTKEECEEWIKKQKEQEPVERWQYVGEVNLEEDKKEQKEYVSDNFDDVWATEDCAEIIEAGEKLSPRFKELFKEVCHAWYDKGIELGKHKEQKPNIELIQKSWYMEGYHDRKFNNEPKWIIKTGEGGPRYEENPKYGQHIEEKPAEWVLPEDFEEAVYKVANFISPFDNQEELRKASHRFAEQLLSLAKKELDKPTEKQDYSGLNDFEQAIHRGFLCAGVQNVPVAIIKETAQDCLAQLKPAEWDELQAEFRNINEAFEDGKKEVVAHPEKCGLCKPTEWNEEDESYLQTLTSEMEANKKEAQEYEHKTYDTIISWLKALPLSLKKRNEDVDKLCSNEWTEEDEKNLELVIDCIYKFYPDPVIKYKLKDWLKSLRPVSKESLQPHWKPSEEQMKALYSALNDAISLYSNKVSPLYEEISQKHFDALESLYNDLKKLM